MKRCMVAFFLLWFSLALEAAEPQQISFVLPAEQGEFRVDSFQVDPTNEKQMERVLDAIKSNFAAEGQAAQIKKAIISEEVAKNPILKKFTDSLNRKLIGIETSVQAFQEGFHEKNQGHAVTFSVTRFAMGVGTLFWLYHVSGAPLLASAVGSVIGGGASAFFTYNNNFYAHWLKREGLFPFKRAQNGKLIADESVPELKGARLLESYGKWGATEVVFFTTLMTGFEVARQIAMGFDAGAWMAIPGMVGAAASVGMISQVFWDLLNAKLREFQKAAVLAKDAANAKRLQKVEIYARARGVIISVFATSVAMLGEMSVQPFSNKAFALRIPEVPIPLLEQLSARTIEMSSSTSLGIGLGLLAGGIWLEIETKALRRLYGKAKRAVKRLPGMARCERSVFGFAF